MSQIIWLFPCFYKDTGALMAFFLLRAMWTEGAGQGAADLLYIFSGIVLNCAEASLKTSFAKNDKNRSF